MYNIISMKYIPRTSSTVSRSYGFWSSMPLMMFMASSETLGQGSLSKFMSPLIIACAIPSSVSVTRNFLYVQFTDNNNLPNKFIYFNYKTSNDAHSYMESSFFILNSARYIGSRHVNGGQNINL